MSSIAEKKRKRILFLKKLYEKTDGNPSAIIKEDVIGQELEFDLITTRIIADYLNGEGLIKSQSIGGHISITHNGVRMIEVSIESTPEGKELNGDIPKAEKPTEITVTEIPFIAHRGKDPYIFVSYSHIDKKEVYSDMEWLFKNGFRIWYDEGIPPSSEWPAEIESAINNCSFFIIFISPNAIESKNVQNEIFYALQLKKSILPIRLQETELKYGLSMSLGRIQAILKFKMTEDLYRHKLLDSLPKNCCNSAGITDITVKAVQPKTSLNESSTYQGRGLTLNERKVLDELNELLKPPIPLVASISELGSGVVIEGEHIVELSVYRADLETLPGSIGNLVKLEELLLYKNRIARLPNSIGNLKKLRVLNLSKNRLKRLPDSVGWLYALETLDLMDNDLLKTLPYSLLNLPNLKNIKVNEGILDLESRDLLGKLRNKKAGK
ncbi:MAG TPA: TIR domain-containing protein [Candidatus Deferrimicrobium sp.]|nr:TIR domain-containing protein [Candidatus Deferrimicrobium sp.]